MRPSDHAARPLIVRLRNGVGDVALLVPILHRLTGDDARGSAIPHNERSNLNGCSVSQAATSKPAKRDCATRSSRFRRATSSPAGTTAFTALMP